MADSPQSFEHHSRLDPAFHFFLVPVFSIGLVMSLVHFIYHFRENDARDNFHAFLIVLLAFSVLALVFKVRLYSLKVQDRIIRLEERIRLGQILQEPLRSRIPELTVDQLVGLRFASDAEVPNLVQRTLTENLSRKEIKKSIQNWRPDHFRV